MKFVDNVSIFVSPLVDVFATVVYYKELRFSRNTNKIFGEPIPASRQPCNKNFAILEKN